MFSAQDLEAFERLIVAEACERSLFEFYKRAWPYFDSSRYAYGWHLEAISDHLENVTSGAIKRLVINVPPRFSKTSLVAIAWPAWTWARKPDPLYPLQGPGVRFLCAAYNATKAQADGVTARRLIGSTWYQQLWGDRVVIAPDRDNQEQYDTVAGGSRISTGIPESLGKGGAIRLCFPAHQMVLTEHGPMAIGDIVTQRRPLSVPSLNEQTGLVELKRITAWHRNPASPIVRLTFDNGLVIHCTPCHRLLVAGGQWKAAAEIPIGSIFTTVGRRQINGDVSPALPSPDSANGYFAEAIAITKNPAAFAREEDGPSNRPCDLGIRVAFPCSILRLGRERPVSTRIIDVLRPGAISEIRQNGIARTPVSVANLLAVGHRADECLCDEDMDADVISLPILAQRHAGISMVGAGFEQHAALAIAPTAQPLHIAFDAADSAHVGNFVIREASQSTPDFIRLVSRDFVDHADVTYCVTVDENHNILVGDGNAYVIAANCDDPHKTDDVESAATIERQIRAYREVWKTRSNDPKFGAEVIIMQRLSQNDLSGYVLAEDPDVVHLMLPLEYEPSRHCVTSIGYEDPRGLDDQGERLEGLNPETWQVTPNSPIAKQAGALLWPERHDADWARKMASEVGPYAYSGQFQQLPVPRGGGLIEREWWKLWEPRLFPDFGQIVASLDGAYTENQINDPSALTVWGSYPDPAMGGPRIMLRDAWQAHLQIDKLIERVAETCKTLKVDVLLIEGKASGISVAQEIRRIYGSRAWQTIVVTPKGDKYERLMQVAPLFANGLIYAPDRDWCDMVIDQVSLFPRAKHDDLADSTSQALYWMRQHGVVIRREEYEEEIEESRRYKKPVAALYDV